MADILENGDIYFLWRPRIDDQRDVQRLIVVLHSWRNGLLRLLVVGRKRLPGISEHERSWWFVDRVARRPEELREAWIERTYQTKTRGERTQPAARSAGGGAYVIARHEKHTHLAYELEHPWRPGRAQYELNIEPQASFVVTVKHPWLPVLGRPTVREPRLPLDLVKRFRGRRFIPLDPPDLLDYPGTEIVLIGAARDAAQELGVDLDAERERTARGALFESLRR